MGREQLTITVTGEEHVETVQNALEAAAEHMDAELDQTRGRVADGAVSTKEALVQVSGAYTGWTGGGGSE